MFSVAVMSTVIVYILLFTLYSWLDYFDIVPPLMNQYYVAIIMISMGLLNYYFFVKHSKFLELGFRKDFKGGFGIVLCLLITVVLFVTAASYNRAKIFEEQKTYKRI